MQQFSMVCMIADHDQKQIEYFCIYPECNLSRLACSKCVKMFNHQHQQQDQSHVLDRKELYKVLSEKLSNRQKKQSMEYNHSDEQLYQLLQRLRNNGFYEFDDVYKNILMNIDKKVDDIKTSILDQSNNIPQMQQEYKIGVILNNQIRVDQRKKINYAKHKAIAQYQVKGGYIESSAISNDFKYIVSGGTEKKLKIWNYSNNKLIKSIQLDGIILMIKFTDDSRLLYVGINKDLYQFDVNNNFKQTYKESLHQDGITNIFCITNTIILTCSYDQTIIKTDVNLKQQLLFIKAHDHWISGLDYNQNLDMIASSSYDKSIKIWNGNNGQLVLQKQNANNSKFGLNCQVSFILNGNQLISLDHPNRTIFLWKINYQTKQLECQQLISDDNNIYNISLMLNQQYITLVCSEYIKIYSIQGDFIKQFNHDVQELWAYNTIQPQSMKAIIIQGEKILKICKLKIDLD